MSTSASILKETFGYDTFRPLQHEVIEKKLERVNGDKLLELLAGLENLSERGAQVAMLKSDDSV